MSDEKKPTRPANPFASATGNPQKMSIGSLIADTKFLFSPEQLTAIEHAIDAGKYEVIDEGITIECADETIMLPYIPDLKITKTEVQELLGSLAVQELERMAKADEIDVTITKTEALYDLKDVYIAADRARKQFGRSAKLQERLYPEIEGHPVRYVSKEQFERLNRDGGLDNEGRHYILLDHPQEQIVGIDITKDGTEVAASDGTFVGDREYNTDSDLEVDAPEEDTELAGDFSDDEPETPEGHSPGQP